MAYSFNPGKLVLPYDVARGARDAVYGMLSEAFLKAIKVPEVRGRIVDRFGKTIDYDTSEDSEGIFTGLSIPSIDNGTGFRDKFTLFDNDYANNVVSMELFGLLSTDAAKRVVAISRRVEEVTPADYAALHALNRASIENVIKGVHEIPVYDAERKAHPISPAQSKDVVAMCDFYLSTLGFSE
jgi:hypothetical protein